MTVTGPRVRDFTSAERRLRVEVVSGSGFELLLTLFVLHSVEGEKEYEIDDEWFDEIRSRAPAGLIERLKQVGDWAVWLSLVGEVHRMGAPYTAERFFEYLAEVDPIELRARMLMVGAEHAGPDVGSDDIARLAAEGPEALGDRPDWCAECDGLLSLIEMPPAQTREVLRQVLEQYWSEVRPVAESTVAVLERDAEHKQALARRMDPERVIEKATNGVTVAVRPDLKGVVLIPSVVVRPWVLISEREGLRIFCYSVADEHLSADPDAPPRWLVEFYKALADERRLSILRRLARGPASFGELVELLDLAKSTVHHHVRQLRSAGLVRVTVGDEKEYSLRTDAVPESARLLEGFLGVGPGAD